MRRTERNGLCPDEVEEAHAELYHEQAEALRQENERRHPLPADA